MAGKVEKDTTIEIPTIKQGSALVNLLGTTPLICNRMSEKAKRTILLPAGRMTQAAKASNLKHDPLAEYQASCYRVNHGNPALVALMSAAFKKAMSAAALDLPGANKTQIGRLVYVAGDYTPIFGKPYLFMAITRSADMNKTPDIRTRAILPRWAAVVSISYVEPILTKQAVVNLISAAGVTVGVGDWRAQKGAGNYGSFRVVNADDPELLEVMAEGYAVQKAALEDPEPYDAETADLLAWWGDEVKRRGKEPIRIADLDEETENEEGESDAAV